MMICVSYVDMACNRRSLDGGLFKRSSLEHTLERNAIDIPCRSVIIGDAGGITNLSNETIC